MKAFEDYILSYPETNLNTFSERYFGYPEKVIVDTLSFVSSDFNWQSSKIGIVNDFGFQVVKYLFIHKCIDLSSITILTTETKCIDSFLEEFSWTGLNFDYIDLDNKSMSKEKFDLIIANPPYGKDSSLAAKIVANILEDSSQLLLLTPYNIYKYDRCLKAVKSFKKVENYFSDASLRGLIVANLIDEKNNSFCFEDFCFSTKQKTLAKAIKFYNQKHVNSYVFCTIQTGTKKKLDKNIEDFIEGNVEKAIVDNSKLSVREALEKRLMFLITVRTPYDGVHINPAHDWTYNFDGIWKKEWENGCPANSFYFSDTCKVENFKAWWYSCLPREKERKFRSGLTNACLDLCRDGLGGNSAYYDYFPNVDWSRPWTDEEILEEIGLPKDFLTRDYPEKE